MKIIDRYIIKKYLGTFTFMLLLLSIVVFVIDVQAKKPRIDASDYELSDFLIGFYPFWIIYLIMTFMSILVFISVIYFTSRIANNTEIVAIISSGVSFHRFAKPYLLTSLFIGVISLGVNHFVLPWANTKKNAMEPYIMNTMDREKVMGSAPIATQISKDEYLFIDYYNKGEKRGSGFSYKKYDKDRKLTYQLLSSEISWNAEKKVFVLNNYFEKTFLPKDRQKINNGHQIEKSFGFPPEELFPDQLIGQNKLTPELMRFIQREREKGNSHLNTYLNDLHQRTSMPVSIVILTVLALSLSSQKRRGGIGMNLAIGILLAFIFVFSFEALKVVAEKNVIPPLLAMWLPNMVFAPLAAVLYWKRANQ
ncbi:LptF/LptG family permease [Bergeyella zoohelcum]|uniref:Lipopolysaccharide ABC transporter permease n=1 Tax=Bergeyella zoohelcum TaxID=1015 RepID=A0A7Z9CGI9_9FLAO|nr:LptF/LptG family permease [Bergeyella zoohelcum]VDH03320.1 lipopolysaccharide ABC transporter permease [Bergeyella zoohelcum]